MYCFLHAHMHACMLVYVSLCMHICIHVVYIYVCIHTLAGAQRLEIHAIRCLPLFFFHIIFKIESPSEHGVQGFDQTR